ncbi:MAG: MFS transporter, partial [Lysobacteraceae bacterium]
MSSLDSAAAAVHANGRARLSVVLLAVSAFVIVTTEFLIVGLLPALACDLGLGIARAGQLVTLFAFTVMLAGPPLTALLSHVSRRRLFVAILLLFAGSNALAAMATQPWLLALARVLPALALPVFWGTASETAAQLADAATQRQIEGVISISSQPITRRLPTSGPISFGRGLEVTINCEDGAFEG